jgi:Zn-finger nucleic acid-binding protein
MNCPACKSKTVEQGFEGARGAKVLLDVCPTCHGLWFDQRESIQLSSNGVLRLFRQMHGRKDEHYRLKEPLACPRCRATLARTQDLARGNRFQYFLCPNTHGHFITFFQLLREKGIVRSLSPKELTELRKHAQLIQCSDCGDPISLERDSACPRCHAPVCILDPKALGATREGLKPAAVAAGAVVAPAVAAQILMDQMGIDGFFRRVDSQVHAASQLGAHVPGAGDPGRTDRVKDVVEGTAEAVVEGVVEVGVEGVVEGGVDLIDLGVEFFLDIASGIGDLF